MSVPTKTEVFSSLTEHIRLAEEDAYKLMHLARANDDKAIADGWFSVGELFKRLNHQVIMLATKGRLN